MYHCIFLLYNWYYSVIKGPKTWPQCPRCCKLLRPASLLCVCVCVAHPALSQTESRLFCSETFQIWALKKVLWLSCQFVTSCVSPACDTFIISFSNVSYKSYKTVFSSLTISSNSVVWMPLKKRSCLVRAVVYLCCLYWMKLGRVLRDLLFDASLYKRVASSRPSRPWHALGPHLPLTINQPLQFKLLRSANPFCFTHFKKEPDLQSRDAIGSTGFIKSSTQHLFKSQAAYNGSRSPGEAGVHNEFKVSLFTCKTLQLFGIRQFA